MLFRDPFLCAVLQMIAKVAMFNALHEVINVVLEQELVAVKKHFEGWLRFEARSPEDVFRKRQLLMSDFQAKMQALAINHCQRVIQEGVPRAFDSVIPRAKSLSAPVHPQRHVQQMAEMVVVDAVSSLCPFRSTLPLSSAHTRSRNSASPRQR